MTTGHRFLLDTDTVSSLVRDPHGPVARMIARHGADTVATSVVVAAELRFGAAKRGSKRLADQLDSILRELDVLPLESTADVHYAELRVALERAGTPVGPNDMLIAAHARSADLVLVTGNVREFRRVPMLEVIDWMS
jgi:tRNA(fMet)-specific endonuclease VapC